MHIPLAALNDSYIPKHKQWCIFLVQQCVHYTDLDAWTKWPTFLDDFFPCVLLNQESPKVGTGVHVGVLIIYCISKTHVFIIWYADEMSSAFAGSVHFSLDILWKPTHALINNLWKVKHTVLTHTVVGRKGYVCNGNVTPRHNLWFRTLMSCCVTLKFYTHCIDNQFW